MGSNTIAVHWPCTTTKFILLKLCGMKVTVCEGLPREEVATAVPAPLSKVKDLFLRCPTTSSTSFQTGEDLYIGWEGLQAAPQGRQPHKPPPVPLSRSGSGRPQADPAPLSPAQRAGPPEHRGATGAPRGRPCRWGCAAAACPSGGSTASPPARAPGALRASPGGRPRDPPGTGGLLGGGAGGRGAAERHWARDAAAGPRWRAGGEREAAGGGPARSCPGVPAGPGGGCPGSAGRRGAERSGAGQVVSRGGWPSPCQGLAAPSPFLSVL